MKPKSLISRAFALGSILAIAGCRPNGPEWDIDVLAPAMETTITAANLIGEDNLTADPQGKLFLDYFKDVYNFSLDTISTIENIVTKQDVSWTLFETDILPGTAFPTQNFSLSLDLNGPQLTNAVIKDGLLRLTIKSVITTKVNFTYEVPKATKNGVMFTYTDVMPASNGTDTVVYTKTFSLTGYELDLRGPNASQFNKLTFSITPTLDPNGSSIHVTTNQFLFQVKNELIELEPSYIQGYFGQVNVLGGADTAEIDFMKKLISGTIDFPAITMDMILENNLGANIRIKPQQFVSINSHTGNAVQLSHASIGSSINVDRATKTGSFPPVAAALETIHFDGNNSNLEAFMENLPDQVGFDFEAFLNPFGNISGNNDFLYTQFPPKVKLHIQAPLKAAINNLVFQDTLDYNLTNATELDNFIDGQFMVYATNRFPLEMSLNLYLVDAQGVVTDTLFSQDLIQSATVNGFGLAIAEKKSVLAFPITVDKIAALKSADRMVLKARLLSKPPGMQAHLQSEDFLRLKLVGDIQYHVNL